MTPKNAAIGIVMASAVTLLVIAVVSRNTRSPVIPDRMPAVEDTANQQTQHTDPESQTTDPPNFIRSLRARGYDSGAVTVEETLAHGSNYTRYIASYMSDGSKVYGLLTVPDSEMPKGGFPTILMLHGYIVPSTYSTVNSYSVIQDSLARNGFVTFKPDFRGHGKSEGTANGYHLSEYYIVDSLNALSALEKFEAVNPQSVGIWGHSNGAETGLRILVISDKLKAAVFWAGLVGSFRDELETFIDKIWFFKLQSAEGYGEYGSPSGNPVYWNNVDPHMYLDSIVAPVQLHHGTNDGTVPIELSRSLSSALARLGKTAELHEYPNAGHNLDGASYTPAIQRTVRFFERYLK